MTNITELTAEKLEEIRQRYRPTLAPKCHICGVEMTIQRMSASRITYGCAGAFYDETGCHYAEGRSLADDHYAESRITVVDVSDPDVLAMVEALEKARQQTTESENRVRKQNRHICELFDDNTALRQRIAELESRTVTAPQNDYFASLVVLARVSADKAMKKFPQPNYVLLKVAEEAGEVVQAGVHYAENRMEWKQVEGEIVQLLAMLIRLVTEGDQINGVTPPASCAAGIKAEAE